MFYRFSYLSIGGIFLLISLVNGYPSGINTEQCLNYCFNDAVCLMNNNNPTCYCLPEWEGERCDIVRKVVQNDPVQFKKINRTILRNDPCSYVPTLCNGKGVCYVDGGKLTCQCQYPFAGTRCDEYSLCYNYCFNDGICTIESDEPECKCGEDFDGLRCNIRKTTTLGPTTTTTTGPTTTTTTGTTTTDVICSFLPENYCNSGFCVVSNGRALCQCPPSHTGDQCQTPTGWSPGPEPIVTGQTNPPVTPIQPTPPVTPIATNPPIAGVTCANSPCRNNRPCYNNGNSFFCYCGQQFTGTHCEIQQG
ncbi:unnamed protein product [Rotaria sordida]|uniref:EGF-like domain-containing protein n=2 Tax=Rotaria sordida TaxID=392033 RepID=A0A815FH78_9BILA|nr:unnamed protein product [Rotaria sordida]CAF1328610.1 unnamed protein product [Rotaria sordida]